MAIIDVGLLWLIVWLLKNAVADVSHAVKGTENPRYKGKPARKQPRYGGRDWFNDLLSDGLEAQTEWRRRRAADKHAAREQAALSDEDAEDDEDAAGGPGGRPFTPPAPVPAGNGGPAPAGSTGPTSTAVHRDQHSYCVTSCGPDCTAKTFGWLCSACGEDRNFTNLADAQADRAKHVCPGGSTAPTGTSGPADGRATGPQQQPQFIPRQPQSSAHDGQDAQVIPLFRSPATTAKESDMSTEVIGLDQSIGYANQLRDFAGQHGSAGNEGYIGHLTQAKVAGEALQSAHEMQAAFDAAMAAAAHHADELVKQKAVQEQYDANPDAGDKKYQQEGR